MKSFSPEDEIRQYAERMRAAYERKAGMLITPDRMDTWLVKGFDGLCDRFLSRSNEDTPSEKVVLALERLLKQIDYAIKDDRTSITEKVDELLIDCATTMGDLLMRRILDSGLGNLSPDRKRDLNKYRADLMTALRRMKQK